MDTFRNKVAESGIITLNLEEYIPQEEIVEFDVKDYLFMGLILKEKDFRESLKQLDTSIFQGKIVGVHCSADAIIPVWAYMLISSLLQPVAARILMGNKQQVTTALILENIQKIDTESYKDSRVVLKGCGEIPIPAEAYLALTAHLRPVVKSIMYGEPCSTVPVYKRAGNS
jgi:hypothetical protein